MSSFIVNVTNTSGDSGTVQIDSGFAYTDRLSDLNEGRIRITSTGETRRGLFEAGSIVSISRNSTLEFKGIINNISFLDAGGIAADLQGYEAWLGKENGDYSGSPWTSTASATIASAIVGESSYFTMGTNEAGESVDFRVAPTSSLWNALASLTRRTGQDIGIDYINSEVDILDHKGSTTSVATFNDRVQIQDLTVRHSYPIANDVRVYGQSEGQTRIKSNESTSGQDATSKSTYGTIRKIHDDPTVTTVAEANTLANKLVAKWKDPVKIYEFEVINPNVSIVSGDVITLNAKTKGLSNESVRVISTERGVREDHEFLTLTVANEAYSGSTRTVEKALAELENRANDLQNYDQYLNEYSNQTTTTGIGGLGCIGNGVCGCSGDWLYLNANFSAPAHVMQMCTLNVNTSAIGNKIDGTLEITGATTIGAFTIPNTDGTAGQVLCTNGSGTLAWGAGSGGAGCYWQDGTDPYICTCGGCGITMTGNLHDSDSTHSLGVASSPGAFKDVNAACGVFTTCATAPTIYASTLICGGDVCAVDDVLVGDDVNAGGDIITNTGTLKGAYLNINGSSACRLYVSGNATITGNLGGVDTLTATYASTTCTCASSRLTLPVGTNCY